MGHPNFIVLIWIWSSHP